MKIGQAAGAALAGARNFLLGANLAALSLVARPETMFRAIAESLFVSRAVGSRRGLPQKNVFEVLPSAGDHTIRLGGLRSPDHWFWPQSAFTADIISLCLICQIIRPKTIFEIGTLNGYTALHFALNSPDDARVYTLDLPREGEVSSALPTTLIDDLHVRSRPSQRSYCFDGTQVADKITPLLGDSAAFDFSPYRRKVDLFFIDGAHSYPYVRSDTRSALECCHTGSVIAWHDFGRPGADGVTRWLKEFARDHEVYAIPGGSLAFMLVE